MICLRVSVFDFSTRAALGKKEKGLFLTLYSKKSDQNQTPFQEKGISFRK